MPRITGSPLSGAPAAALSRRSLIRGSAAAATALTLPATMHRRGTRASAQTEGLDGEIAIGFEDPADRLSPYVDEVVRTVQDANPDAEIEIRKSPGGNYAVQLFLSLTTGRAPDVFLINGLGIGELAAAGYLEPLDAYVAAWDGWQQYPDVIKRALTFQDHVWAIPWSTDVHFLYYRKDIFAQAGLPDPWQPATPDDILAAARQIQAEVPDVTPYAIYAGANGGNGTATRGFLPLLYAFGGSMQDEARTWIIDSCPIRQTLAYYETAFQTDQTVPQHVMTATSPESEMREAFGEGKLGMLFEGSWAYGPWHAADAEAASANIGYVLHPTANGDAPFTIGGIGYTWYINAKSEHKDLAWEFVKQMNTKETHIALNTLDPHVPARTDAAQDPGFQTTQFFTDMVAASANARISPPDPSYRKLIGIVQNATGIVATGEVAPEEAVERYASELTRVLGDDQVVAEPCL